MFFLLFPVLTGSLFWHLLYFRLTGLVNMGYITLRWPRSSGGLHREADRTPNSYRYRFSRKWAFVFSPAFCRSAMDPRPVIFCSLCIRQFLPVAGRWSNVSFLLHCLCFLSPVASPTVVYPPVPPLIYSHSFVLRFIQNLDIFSLTLYPTLHWQPGGSIFCFVLKSEMR